MIIPLLDDRTRGVDLRSLPGSCNVYIDGEYRWNSNVSKNAAAQALWKAIKKNQDVCVEPLDNYQSVPVDD